MIVSCPAHIQNINSAKSIIDNESRKENKSDFECHQENCKSMEICPFNEETIDFEFVVSELLFLL